MFRGWRKVVSGGRKRFERFDFVLCVVFAPKTQNTHLAMLNLLAPSSSVQRNPYIEHLRERNAELTRQTDIVVSKNLAIKEFTLHFGVEVSGAISCPAIFVSEASVFRGATLASETKSHHKESYPRTANTTTIATMAARDDSVAATGIRSDAIRHRRSSIDEGEIVGRTAADERGAETADEMDETPNKNVLF